MATESAQDRSNVIGMLQWSVDHEYKESKPLVDAWERFQKALHVGHSALPFAISEDAGGHVYMVYEQLCVDQFASAVLIDLAEAEDDSQIGEICEQGIAKYETGISIVARLEDSATLQRFADLDDPRKHITSYSITSQNYRHLPASKHRQAFCRPFKTIIDTPYYLPPGINYDHRIETCDQWVATLGRAEYFPNSPGDKVFDGRGLDTDAIYLGATAVISANS